MAEYITAVRTADGDKQIDYRSLANRPPDTHADEHAIGGKDPITPESIGAVSLNSVIFARIVVTAETGSDVICTDGKTTLLAIEDNGTWTFYPRTYGEWTVTATLGENSLEYVVDVDAARIYRIGLGTKLEDFTWEQISKISKLGKGQNYWSVGDTKSVLVNGTIDNLSFGQQDFSINQTLYVYILGFDHNKAYEGPGITFGTFKTEDGTDVALVSDAYGSTTATNDVFSQGGGYWPDCNIRNHLCSEFYFLLPEELRNVITICPKYTWMSNVGDYIVKTTDVCFALSAFEVTGVSHVQTDELSSEYQEQYQYYKDGNSYIKYKYNNTSVAAAWFGRDAYDNPNNTLVFGVNGKFGNGGDTYSSYGFAPAFKV